MMLAGAALQAAILQKRTQLKPVASAGAAAGGATGPGVPGAPGQGPGQGTQGGRGGQRAGTGLKPGDGGLDSVLRRGLERMQVSKGLGQ